MREILQSADVKIIVRIRIDPRRWMDLPEDDRRLLAEKATRIDLGGVVILEYPHDVWVELWKGE